MISQFDGVPVMWQPQASKIMEFSAPPDPNGRPCVPTQHRRSRLPLTNSAGIQRLYPKTSRVFWMGCHGAFAPSVAISSKREE